MYNAGYIEELGGILSTGKEANVYYGVFSEQWEDEEADETGKKQVEKGESFECAIKIFKTTLQEFRNRENYIRDDSRYVGRIAKHNPRKLIRVSSQSYLFVDSTQKKPRTAFTTKLN